MQDHPRPSLPTTRTRNLHAVVLAAGGGRRATGSSAAPIPRQFCAFGGSRSLLQQTLDRLSPLTPARRTLVTVDRPQFARATWQTAAHPGITLVVQSCDRGTAAGVFLPLLHVLLRDPSAIALVTPSDHGVEDAAAYARTVGRAVTAVHRDPAQIVVFGAPDGPLPDTMLTIGRVDRLLALYRPLGELMSRLRPCLDALATGDDAHLARLCEELPELDFTRDVLANAHGLTVQVLPRKVGWTDLRWPDRLTAWALRQSALPVARAAPGPFAAPPA